MLDTDVIFCGVLVFSLTSRLLGRCVCFACRSLQRKGWALQSLSQGIDPDFFAPTRKAQTSYQNWICPTAKRMPSSWRCVSVKIKSVHASCKCQFKWWQCLITPIDWWHRCRGGYPLPPDRCTSPHRYMLHTHSGSVTVDRYALHTS